MFQCQECGRKFKTADAAERAMNNGCPKCGGSDIDLHSVTMEITTTRPTRPLAVPKCRPATTHDANR